MSVVTRYFSTAAAGGGDGTTWADRAALFSAGNWSTVLTGFAFNGSDSMLALLGPGDYTCGQTLATGLFTNAPTAANPLDFHGCDGSGNLLTPPDPDWTSDMPPFTDTALPNITGSATNSSLAAASWRLVKFTSTRPGAILTAGYNIDWCVFINNANNANAGGVLTVNRITNCYVSLTQAAYDYGINLSGWSMAHNCRIQGVTGTSGNRNGLVYSGTTGYSAHDQICVIGVGGTGFISTSSNVGQTGSLVRSVLANCGAGILLASTASQTSYWTLLDLCITGCTGTALDLQSAARAHMGNIRTRDNGAGASNLGNYTLYDAYTTDADDAADYNNAVGGDYRIKATAGFAGRNIGVSQMSAGAMLYRAGMEGT